MARCRDGWARNLNMVIMLLAIVGSSVPMCQAFGLFPSHVRLGSRGMTGLILRPFNAPVVSHVVSQAAESRGGDTTQRLVEEKEHGETGAGGEALWRVDGPLTAASLLTSFKAALAARLPLMRRLAEEETDCYRLFHGAVEGCPGLTIDRYGTVVLVQTFRNPPVDFGPSTVDEMCRIASIVINAVESKARANAAAASSTTAAAVADESGDTAGDSPGVDNAPENFQGTDGTFLPVWNDRRKKDRRRQTAAATAGDPNMGHSQDFVGEGSFEHRSSWEGQKREGGAGGDGARPSGTEGADPHRLSSEHEPSPEALGVKVGVENGVRYPLAARHRGIDPWLFLDLRAARRWVLTNSEGLEVLNLFSYTGGVAAAAACGGAKSVWNVDFSASAHEVGRASLKLNAEAAEDCTCEWMKLDVLPTIRQLAGIATKDYRRDKRGRGAAQRGAFRGGNYGRGRGSGGRYGGYAEGARGAGGGGSEAGGRGGGAREKEAVLKPKQFDIVFLDPPTWSKSGHGAVDLVRDYQSLFKPSLLATKKGGAVVATNHVSTVDCAEWMATLSRCALKAGREVEAVQVLPPEEDFPSPDGRHPLKVAVFRV